MFQFIGLDFFSDGDALANAPGQVDGITTIRLTNAIYGHFNVTRNTEIPETTTPPSEWDFDTIIDATFDGNLNAGNVDFVVEQLTSVKIKRRKRGEFEWLTIKTIPVNSVEDLSFVFNDMLNQYGVEYEYAIVPVIEDTEGEYIINSVLSEFVGVFITDGTNIYKFLYEVGYNNNQRNQQIGTFEVLGNKYPVIVANGELSYDTGSVTATIVNDDFSDTAQIDYEAIRDKKDALKDFLTNKKAKILKDWRGATWLVVISNNVSIGYLQGTGMGIPTVTFDWTQIGDAFDQYDLMYNGIIDVEAV